jgi:BirA family biotin operon repressor/biotin-[acetyl-CoA-carboxylase] ligase
MLGALGVLACLRGLGFPAQLKWPNDVLVHGRKISGILVESRSSATAAANAEAVVLGIGINVSVRAGELPQDLRRKATSIHIEGGTAQREEVLGQLLHSLDGGLLDLEAEAGPERISASFSARLGIVDTRLSFATHQEEGEGIGVGLLPDGTLEVRQEKGELRRIAGGHLQWLRLRPS